MKRFKNNSSKGDSIVEFFTPATSGLEKVEIGSVVMNAHTESSWAKHDGDEYSYLVSGEMTCYAKNEDMLEEYKVQAGDAICTPAGQEHKSVNTSDQDCFIIWVEVAK